MYIYIVILITIYIYTHTCIRYGSSWKTLTLQSSVGDLLVQNHPKVDSKPSTIHSEWCLCPPEWVSQPLKRWWWSAYRLKQTGADVIWYFNATPPIKQPFGVYSSGVLHLFLFQRFEISERDVKVESCQRNSHALKRIVRIIGIS